MAFMKVKDEGQNASSVHIFDQPESQETEGNSVRKKIFLVKNTLFGVRSVLITHSNIEDI